MKQRPQYIMEHFAKQGHEAHYINKDVALEGCKSYKKTKKINDNFYLHPETTDPRTLKCDVLYYTYPPAGLERKNKCKIEIFDSCDEPEGAFKFWNMDNAYYKALERADLVLASSKKLYKTAKEYNDNVILSLNACEYPLYEKEYPKPPELERLDGPIIGYSGAIATWVDISLIRQSAKRFPDYNFVIIGAQMNDYLTKMPDNVYYLKTQPADMVPAFLQHFDVCTIPFKVNQPETIACNPIKLWEYFAAGKPIVSTCLPETNMEGVLWSNRKMEYMNNLESAIKNKNSNIKNGKKIAKKNSWESRVKEILENI